MKILCVHATAGAGHQKAAEAVYDALRRHTSHDVRIVDALDYTSPAFKKSYKNGYAFLITKIPGVWAFFFALTDQSWMQPFVRLGRCIYNHCNARKLEEFLFVENFDCIVSCHFLSTERVSRLKKQGKLRARLVTVVTDFDVHRLWLGTRVDHYAAASEFTKERLESYGIPSSKISVTGIPTHEKFSEAMDRNAVRAKLGLKPDVFTVLMATGSFGIGPIEEVINKLDGFQVAVICGHNKNLYQTLNRTVRPHVKVFGLVDNMQEMMAASDAMVTKPGGLSISEALVRRLPMIFFSAIPGQEQGNVRVLAGYGIGVMSTSLNHIVETLTYWRDNPSEYQDQRGKMNQLAHPDAAREIIALIESF